MRTLGLCTALLAAAQLTVLSSPAFAQPAPAPAAPPPVASPPAPVAAPAAPAAPAPAPAATPTPPPVAPADGAPAPVPPPPAEAPAAVPPPPAVPAEASVEVHVDTTRPVSLERRATPAGPWEFICTSPCDQRVAVAGQYRIVGTELNESAPFTLDGSKGRSVLTVKPGIHNDAEVGKWTLIGAGAVALGGVAVLVFGATPKADATGELNQSAYNTIFIGTAMIFAGLAGSIYGGARYLDNAHTGVDGDLGRVLPEKSAPPTEVKGEVKIGAALPRAYTMPIFSTSF